MSITCPRCIRYLVLGMLFFLSSTIPAAAHTDAHPVMDSPAAPTACSIISGKLNAILPSNSDVDHFLFNEDSCRVVYLANPNNNQVDEPFSTNLTNGVVVALNVQIAVGQTMKNMIITPDGQSLVYIIQDSNPGGVSELFQTPIDGTGLPIKLNAPLTSGGNVQVARISPDGQWVVYQADQDTNNVFELYAVNLANPGTAVKLNGLINNVDGDVDFSYQISPDSQWVVYLADQDIDEQDELYARRIDGSGSDIKLNVPLTHPEGDVDYRFKIIDNPNGNLVVYRADETNNFEYNLYVVPIPISGPPSSTQLNSPLVSGGSVQQDFEIAPSSGWIIYRADQDTDEVFELYKVQPGIAPTKLNTPLISGGDITSFSLSSATQYVVYRADQDTDEVFELYGIAVDNSSPFCRASGCFPPLKLSGQVTSGGDVDSYQISPDGQYVVYRADQDTNEVFELYSRKLVVGQLIKLNDPLVPNGDVSYDFEISPDSTRVIYRADQNIDKKYELFSTPIHSNNVNTLNDPLPLGGDVRNGFIVTPSNVVIYRADQDIDNKIELYAVDIP